MKNHNIIIGEIFAKYRKEKGFSQQYVADRMSGIDDTSFYRFIPFLTRS